MNWLRSGVTTGPWRRRLSGWILSCSSLAVCCVVMGPAGSDGAESFIVVDHYSKRIFTEGKSDSKRQVASLTKIATAMVVLDWAERTGTNLGTWIKVPPSVAGMGGANPLGMFTGDEITIRDGIYSAVIGSDNVAAQTIANLVGYDLIQRGNVRGDPIDAFVDQMNALARANGCRRTRFTNPHGLDHKRPTPYSTASDMARLAIYAMSKASFTYFCSQKERKVEFRRNGELQRFLVKNTNQLLGQEGIDGVKTGMTLKAGQCLIISASKPSTVIPLPDGKSRVIPHRLTVVVLGSGDRFGRSLSHLRSGWQYYRGWEAQGRPADSPNGYLITEP